MLLKATPITVTALESVENTGIAETDLQIVMVEQLQEVIDQLTVNRVVLDTKINKMGIVKVKILLVKRFKGEIV